MRDAWSRKKIVKQTRMELETELRQSDLLALFVDDRGQGEETVPRTRSVILNRSTSHPNAVLMIQGLEFMLYMATPFDVELEKNQLCEWLMQCYGGKHFTDTALSNHWSQFESLVALLNLAHPGLLTLWRQSANDTERLAHFKKLGIVVTGAGDMTQSQQCDSLLSIYRRIVDSEARVPILEAQVKHFSDYRKRMRKSGNYAEVKRQMHECEDFFFLGAVEEMVAQSSWPRIGKGGKARYWSISLKNHQVLEYLVNQLQRYSITLNAEWSESERRKVGGTLVPVKILQRSAAQASMVLQDFSHGAPHDYTLSQLPLFNAKHSRPLCMDFTLPRDSTTRGLLLSSVDTKSNYTQDLTPEHFDALCALGQKNEHYLSDSTVQMQLSQQPLGTQVNFWLVDWKARRTKKQTLDYTQALEREIIEVKVVPKTKRKKEKEEDDVDVILLGVSVAKKKQRYDGAISHTENGVKVRGAPPLKQSRLISAMQYK